MRRKLAGLLLIVAVGCQSSTEPTGFTFHAMVVNNSPYTNYWVNQSLTWEYLDTANAILDHGYITITSDSECLTPPVASPKTARVVFQVETYPNSFAPTQPDWTVTVTPPNGGTVTWSPGLAHSCRDTSPPIGTLPTTYAAVSTGGYHTCGLALTGVAYCWGDNTSWQLGTGGDKSTRVAPTAVATSLHFTSIGAGGFQTCALTSTGAAYCWGRGDSIPVAVGGGLSFVQLAAGGTNHQCALTGAGAAYCWGYNHMGQLGDGDTSTSATPVAVAGGITFASLTTSGGHSCGLTAAGAAYCWGFNNQGQLGDSTMTDRWTPAAVKGALTFASLVASGLRTCGLASSGIVYCWGATVDGSGVNLTPVVTGDTVHFAHLGASVGSHFCGVTASGKGFCWGNNSNGQLGDGNTRTFSYSSVPIAGGLTFLDVNGGSDHSCGVTTAHIAYCWGYNGNGQLGTGSTGGDNATPVAVITKHP